MDELFAANPVWRANEIVMGRAHHHPVHSNIATSTSAGTEDAKHDVYQVEHLEIA
jgi:hypothetical protein